MKASPLGRRNRAGIPTAKDDVMHHSIGDQAARDPDAASARPGRRLEIGASAAAVVLTASVFLLAGAIEVRAEAPGPGPRSWPQFLGGLGFGFSVILLLTAIFGSRPDRSGLEEATRSGWVRLLATITATIVFIVVWPLAGFLVAAPLFISAITAIGGGRKLRALVFYPAGMTAMIYVLFNLLLRVPL